MRGRARREGKIKSKWGRRRQGGRRREEGEGGWGRGDSMEGGLIRTRVLLADHRLLPPPCEQPGTWLCWIVAPSPDTWSSCTCPLRLQGTLEGVMGHVCMHKYSHSHLNGCLGIRKEAGTWAPSPFSLLPEALSLMA